MKNIKEYKLKKKAHKHIELIGLALHSTEQPSYQGENIKANSVNALTLNRLNVLSKWFKPIYEEKIKLPKLFGVEGVPFNSDPFDSDYNGVKYGDMKLSSCLIRELLMHDTVSLNVMHNGRYKLVVKAQLQQIDDYLKSQKND